MWRGKLYLYWYEEKDQNITLSYLANPGPGDPTKKRIVETSIIEGKYKKPTLFESDGTQTISVPLIIQRGLNIVNFKSAFLEKASVIFPHDPCELLVYISQIKKLLEIPKNIFLGGTVFLIPHFR